MREHMKFYIGGEWVEPQSNKTFDVINPATEEISGRIALGDEADVDRAVKAAHKAFLTYSRTSREERISLLERISNGIEKRFDDLAAAITLEMGCPLWASREGQLALPQAHTKVAIEELRKFEFERLQGNTLVRFIPIGVCGLITPWNWPLSVIFTKLLPVLATGCTAILKPSEYSPFSAQLIAELLHDAGVPAGVFNMVFGDGPTVGSAISRHPQVECVSITGSTRAGAEVARDAAATIKRVHQELGGKSPNIILPSANLEKAVEAGLKSLMYNTGQSCSAPSRMLAPNARMEEVKEIARRTVAELQPGPPDSNAYTGPVVNKNQYDRIQALIEKGIAEGATLVTGGPGRAEGFDKGYYIKPTVFADTSPDMAIVREEIFGPVLVVQGYSTVEEAIALALNTRYGLAAYVQGADIEELRKVGDQLEAGQVYLNGTGLDLIDYKAPFGGFKHSGNGREWGAYGFESFLELKALVGWIPSEGAA